LEYGGDFYKGGNFSGEKIVKLKGRLGFNAVLEADIPETGFVAATFSVLNPQAILDMARDKISPLLHNALKAGIMQLSLIGIKVKMIESHVEFKHDTGGA
jgi:hypothetical protein